MSLEWLGTYLTDLASCLCAGVHSAGLPEPCFCGVMPGDAVALDYCQECDGGRCGVAWVRLVAITSQSQSLDPGNTCVVLPVATVEVGIGRCAPMPGSDGSPPSEAEMLGATQTQVVEAAVMRDAITCCADDYDVVLGSYTPMGPNGGCLGGVWSLTVSEF